jgi:uncharacterized protein (DUF2252 family)
MDIIEATSAYERWLRRFVTVVPSDLVVKHRRMRLDAFSFMRATFYRWCQLWNTGAQHEHGVMRVLAVGDLHIENFGTWRDVDGRLIWGINDFDEAAVRPWTEDLVRLAVSAQLAIQSERLRIRRRPACSAILEGYRDGIARGGGPFVLEEDHSWLRSIATAAMREPSVFWQKMNALPTARKIDPDAATKITSAMPERGLAIRFARSVAGMGSLGRPRFVGLARWGGGLVAREVKATAPSAWDWVLGTRTTSGAYQRIINRAVRVPDPTMRIAGKWLVRRLAPHCTRIELADLPTGPDEEQLLYAMGFETANVHLGTTGAGRTIARELGARRPNWLRRISDTLASEILADWKHWRGSARRGLRGRIDNSLT